MVSEIFEGDAVLYADWFDRMLRSDNLDLAIMGAESTHIQDAFRDFIDLRLLSERGDTATLDQIRALETVRRAFLDADGVVQAGRLRGRVTTRFRNILTGRFVSFRSVVDRF